MHDTQTSTNLKFRNRLKSALRQTPIVPILRGITTSEAVPVASLLLDAGFHILEVTLDSPQPFETVRVLRQKLGNNVMITAGTVLQAGAVSKCKDAGAEAVFAPNYCSEVVQSCVDAGLPSIPGVLTPTEAIAALASGASALKIFPGDAVSPATLRGMRAVLPNETPLIVTGGVTGEMLPAYLEAGAIGVGVGSALYKPGKSAQAIAADARHLVSAAQLAQANLW